MTAVEIIFTVLFYITAIAGFVLYIGLMRRSGLQLLSFTGLAYFISCFSVIIPAPYITYGIYFKETGFYEGFKWELFLIYVVFAFLFPLSLWVGRHMAQSVYLNFRASRTFSLRLLIMTFIVSCYTVYAFSSIGFEKLPLVNLLINGNLGEALQYKKDLMDLAKINPLIGKWHVITIPFFMILAFYYYLKKEDGKWLTKTTFAFFFIITLFFTTMRLGRDDFVQFLLAFLFVNTILYKRPFLLKLSILVSIAVLFFFLFSYEQNWNKIALNFVERIINQSAFTYIQIDFVKDGFLWFEGVNMPFLGDLLGLEYKNPSNLAFLAFYGSDFEGGTAGLSYANIYYSFGVLGFVIAFFMGAGLAFIDGCYLNTIFKLEGNIRKIVAAFYFTLIALYCVNVITNFYAFFALPFVFSISFLLIHIYLFVMAGFGRVYIQKS